MTATIPLYDVDTVALFWFGCFFFGTGMWAIDRIAARIERRHQQRRTEIIQRATRVRLIPPPPYDQDAQ